MNSVIDAVNILKSTYQKHFAESIGINTIFSTVKSPFSGESLLKLMVIQDLKAFNVNSEKVRCSTCEWYGRFLYGGFLYGRFLNDTYVFYLVNFISNLFL